MQKEGITVEDVTQDYDISEKQQIKINFFNGVKLDKSYLDVPAANLKKNTQYQV